eukprot:INCI5302.1.p1 GENE.INCI5302.1~~INCI5302.1.p1  ORF type:complete len:363 (+),score=34.76 INCI5302.1:226-1314(+)
MNNRRSGRKSILSGAAASFLMGNSAGVARGGYNSTAPGMPKYLRKSGDDRKPVTSGSSPSSSPSSRSRSSRGSYSSLISRGLPGRSPSREASPSSRTSTRSSSRSAQATPTLPCLSFLPAGIGTCVLVRHSCNFFNCSGRETTTDLDSRRSNRGKEHSQDQEKGGSEPKSGAKAKLCCDKCDKAHETSKCPYYSKGRDKHPDAQRRRHHDFGEAGGNFVLKGARVVRQPGDGSCLFHSMAYGLRKAAGISASATQLRREIAEFLQRNAHMKIAESPLGDWVKWDTGQTVTAYARRMMGGNYWGGGIEIACCVRMKKVNIHVYEVSRRNRSVFKRISCFNCPNATQTAHILYTGGIHYDALAV